ncbi:TIGR02466 family protein [Hyphococcus sp.]|uniref:TIGR02466 family protein n=1 Tax=Hyphococcus sp. TaxID=2038636 RepID=UPI00208C5D8F|nr:MAG: hypothetical protein DHS20C04_26490 [Marinicaulis sp.]
MSESEQPSGFVPEIWFHTPVWSRKVVEHERINKDLLKVLEKLEAETDPITRSNVGGWHSHDQIHHREDMKEICRVIGTACVGCASFMEFDFENFELVIKELWMNKNGGGDFNKAHIHPNAILSGAYYVKTPENSGNIEFYDPVPARLMNVYPVKKRKPINLQAVEYKAGEGQLLIFPSWLQHAVQPNRSKDYRVSISFNIGYKPVARKRAPPGGDGALGLVGGD